jgi:hypothetical protein
MSLITVISGQKSLFAAAGLAALKKISLCSRVLLNRFISITLDLDPMVHVILISLLTNVSLEDSGGFSLDRQTMFAIVILSMLIAEELI